MEYMPTDLPKYTKITSRSELSSSVVQNGHVLLFSEDGQSLTAKLPDGSFAPVSGGSSIDFYKCATVTPAHTETFYTLSGVANEHNGDYYDSGSIHAGYPVYTRRLPGVVPPFLYHVMNSGMWLIGPFPPDDYSDNWENALYHNQSNDILIGWSGGAILTANTREIPGTWTGYKAVQDPVTGIYSFEATATTGLSWDIIHPQVGKIYTADAMIEIANLFTGIPTDYVLHHPLSSAEASVGGYSCEYSNVTFETDSTLGTMVTVFNGNGRITISNVAGSPAVAFSIFQKIDADIGVQQLVVMRDRFGILSTPSNTGIFDFNGRLELHKTFSNTGWHHIYVDYANGVTRLFIDGVEAITTTSYTFDYNNTSNVQMGVHLNGTSHPLSGKLSSLRIYSRALTEAEIAALANEFTPSTS